MKNRYLILIAIIIGACTPAKQAGADYVILDGFAQGTTYHIVYQDSTKRDLTPEITAFFDKFNASLSIYDSTSLVSRLNAGDLSLELDDWFIECFKLSQSVYQKSEGYFDPTLRPLIAAYGFGGKPSQKSLSDIEIDSILGFVGYEKVAIVGRHLQKKDHRTELDYNAIAKGYSVDLLGRMIDSLGIKNYLIEVGGEIVCRGVSPRSGEWKVSIDAPFEGNFTPGATTEAVIELSNVALATSGNYRKFAITETGEKVVHTIDPRTGRPSINNLLSVTIIAPTCAIADGFATACMASGLDGAKAIVAQNPELEALLIYSEGGQMKTFSTPTMQKRIVQNSKAPVPNL